MTIEAGNVLALLEQRIHEAAEAKADAQIQEVARLFEGLAPVLGDGWRAKGILTRTLADLRNALIERHTGEMAEMVVAGLIKPPAAA